MVDFSTTAGQELYEREVRRLMAAPAFMDRQRAEMLAAVLLRSPTGTPEIRPNPGATCDAADGRCEDTDEVVGQGFLHVEQMDKNCYWARLDLPDGRAIVMWFNSEAPITLTAEWD